MFGFLSRIFVIFAPVLAFIVYKQFPYSSLHVSSSRQMSTRFIDTSTPRLFALADIHGDYPRALKALSHAGIVDSQGNWIAGNATFVQTGDVVDRGPDTRRLYAWLRNLTQQATAQHGRVVKLWGNHEYMNALHDWRYVDPGDLASFPPPFEQSRSEAFSMNGSIGRDWMLDYRVTYTDNNYRAHFMHAGIDVDFAQDNVNLIGSRFMKDALSGEHDRGLWSEEKRRFWSPGGPMWFRGYATLPESEACKIAEQVTRLLDVDFLVMGHTPNFENGKLLSYYMNTLNDEYSDCQMWWTYTADRYGSVDCIWGSTSSARNEGLVDWYNRDTTTLRRHRYCRSPGSVRPDLAIGSKQNSKWK